jgi:RNA-directed DNA polymerase
VNAKKANNTKDKVRQLQRKLYLAAKGNSKRRFHALYDKVYREDVLVEAWKRVKANDGTSGIDQISIEEVEGYGVEKFLAEIGESLRRGKYQPKPVRRVYIDKGAGKKRPLGIPVIRDRVVQMATKIAIEPVFEADFKDSSYGFRPKRSMHQALEEVRKATKNNGWWVVDADISGYFDSINHEKLMKLIEMRITDRRILKLIRNWLKAGVVYEGKYEESEIGSPQGGVISPLLSNIYLNYLDTKWELHCQHLGKLVRFADDFVVVCRTKKEAQHALKAIEWIMEKLELQLHPEKTKLINIWDGKEGYDFLGFHHRFKDTRTANGKKFKETHQIPSKKAMGKMREKIRKVFTRSTLQLDIKEMVKTLNPKIVGWRNYYGLMHAGDQLHKIDWYILKKCTVWYSSKKQIRNRYAKISEVRKIIYEQGLQKLVV